MRRALVVLSLLLVAGCVKPKPPDPVPTPTPHPCAAILCGPGSIPTTQPDGTCRCVKPEPHPDERRVGLAPEKLLRPAPEGKIKVGESGPIWHAFMASQCCMAWSKGETAWPMANEAWMDFTHSYGANLWEFRFGPFDAAIETEWASTGGPIRPDVSLNDSFYSRARALVKHAYNLGGYVIVIPVDTWGCKADQNGYFGADRYTGLPQSEIDACGRRSSPLIERHIRRVVEDTTCLPNVLYQTDNEGGQIDGATTDWRLWVRDVIRQAEKDFPCTMPDGSKSVYVHMIGTNTPEDPATVAGMDFVSTHTRAPLTEPIAGRWTINSERNPAFPPGEEAQYFGMARARGLGWAFWRAEMSEPEMLETLGRFRDIAQGTAPPPSDCYMPPDDGRWKLVEPARPSKTRAWVRAATDRIGDRRVGRPGGGWANPDAAAWDMQSLALVAQAIRDDGHCAIGPWVDSVATLAPDGLVEEMHVVAATDGGWTGEPWKGRLWTHPDLPKPVADDGCGAPKPPKVSRWKLVRHNEETGINNATPLVGPFSPEANYCAEVGMPDRLSCPVRAEGHPEREACERAAGGVLWRSNGQLRLRDNPYLAGCTGCTWLEVCTADGTVCSRCATDAAGLCAGDPELFS